ncbi:MAG: dephospho-CoA kinase [Clostridium sp.]
MRVIGLTGNIGSGKSTVSSIIESYNIKIIDADLISREVSENIEVLNSIEKTFGKIVIDNNGSLNRSQLGEIVFSSDEELEKLNSIIHPYMKTRIKEYIIEYSKTERICILDGAIIIEAGFGDLVEDIILVEASEDMCLQRVYERDGHSYGYIKNIIRKQIPLEKKKNFCKYIIRNDKGFEELEKEVIRVLRALDMEA